MADEQTFEVGVTLGPLTVGPYNDVWLYIFSENTKFLYYNSLTSPGFNLTVMIFLYSVSVVSGFSQ